MIAANVLRPFVAAAAVSVALTLAACATEKAPPKVQPLSFDNLPEIRLDVAELQIIPAYAATKRRPQVDHLFHTPPQDALRNWARAKIRAAGNARRAMVVVRQASVIEVPLRTKKGVRGALTKEPSERYEAVIEVELEIRDDTGKRVGWMTTRVSRQRSVQEGISEPERMVFWQKLTGELVTDLARAFDRRVTEHLSKFRK
jgi:hypothetical protein